MAKRRLSRAQTLAYVGIIEESEIEEIEAALQEAEIARSQVRKTVAASDPEFQKILDEMGVL